MTFAEVSAKMGRQAGEDEGEGYRLNGAIGVAFDKVMGGEAFGYDC